MELRQRKSKTYVFDTLEVVYMNRESYEKAISKPFKGIYVDNEANMTLSNKIKLKANMEGN